MFRYATRVLFSTGVSAARSPALPDRDRYHPSSITSSRARPTKLYENTDVCTPDRLSFPRETITRPRAADNTRVRPSSAFNDILLLRATGAECSVYRPSPCSRARGGAWAMRFGTGVACLILLKGNNKRETGRVENFIYKRRFMRTTGNFTRSRRWVISIVVFDQSVKRAHPPYHSFTFINSCASTRARVCVCVCTLLLRHKQMINDRFCVSSTETRTRKPVLW